MISGIVFRRGHPADLIRLGTTGQVNLTVSPAILDEVADVLVRKFRATPGSQYIVTGRQGSPAPESLRRHRYKKSGGFSKITCERAGALSAGLLKFLATAAAVFSTVILA